MPETTTAANPFAHLEHRANYSWQVAASDDEDWYTGPFFEFFGGAGDSFDDLLWLLTETMAEIELTLTPTFAEEFDPAEPQAGYDLLENGTRVGYATIVGTREDGPPHTHA
ncbi:hypothetical protein ACFWPH_28325 [Nocardia sp. NPDC058499]|uniref:hypothetical protein n=1 Tax=Nocardia sp. NPDC058499 TaxID=3346530 RepID=UPI003664A95E